MSRIQLRRDSVTNWLTVNPVLALGELGIAYDGVGADAAVVTIRIGNGVSTWTQLPDFGGNGDLTRDEADTLYASAAQGLKADTALQVGPTAVEYVQDVIGTTVVGGQGVQATYDDSLGTVTLSVSSLAITEVFPAVNEAAMLALPAQRGDVAIRADESRTYILSAEPASTLSNWLPLPTPTDLVLSVNGQTGSVTVTAESLGAVPTSTTVNGHALTGNVTVTKSDVDLGNVDNTADIDKQVSTPQQMALATKVPATRSLAGIDLSADRSAAELRTALTLVPGTDVQAFSSVLATLVAAGTPGATGLAVLLGSTAAAVRSTLGLGTAATTAASDYATAAQGVKADAAAPLASPDLIGTPTAPTATVGTNTTQIATTAFVLANAAVDPAVALITRKTLY